MLGGAAMTTIVTCALLLAGTAGTVAWPRLRHTLGVRPAAAAAAAAYRTGQVVDVPADWYQSSPYTVVLFARAACGPCQTAQPFFKQLVTDLKGRAAVVLVGGDDDREGDVGYGRSLGLKDTGIQMAPEGLKVRATPTLVLVNQRGEILGAWEGVGTATRQTTIAKAIEHSMQ